ncbi:MAG: trypsin-like peptidase domain-containing protein, partial [Candidatus Gracilibacteria bacterium]|nr:trypsin-like peptidase domain-containing protein [Candidatus Gracilibacteria bacterium]
TEKNVSITDLQSQVTKLAKNISPSVVSIIIKKDLVVYKSDPWGFFQTPVGKEKQRVGGGSGFFVRKDGTIITNKHVVSDDNAEYTVITSDGKEFDAKVLAKDPITDLAIIKIIPNIPTDLDNIKVLEFLDENTTTNIGEFVLAIGNALAEFQNTVTFGIISGKGRSIEAATSSDGTQGEKLSGLLQTDTAINPGNSGGPLINLDGKVIAINTAIAGNSQNLGFAIPLSIQKVNYILNSIDKTGGIKRAFVGISYIPLNRSLAKTLGLKVSYGDYIQNKEGSIVKGSNAQKSGLKGGDIITKVDNIKIDEKTHLSDIIQNKIPGDKINLEILRNGETRKIVVELGEY